MKCPKCQEMVQRVQESDNGGYRNVCSACNWFGSIQGTLLPVNGLVDFDSYKKVMQTL